MSNISHAMDYNSGITHGRFNDPKNLGDDCKWASQWCILCGLWLSESNNGVRESRVCINCEIGKKLIEIPKVSVTMNKIKIISLDEQRLRTHLHNHPNDEVTRKILADILEEEGREYECQCQRWLIENHKYPDSKLKVFNLSGWHWWSCVDTGSIHKERLHAVIPEEIQKFMPKGEWLYSSRIEAEEVLALALVAYYGSKQHA